MSIIKKNKTKKKTPELILIEDVSSKNIKIKALISKRCNKGTKKYKPLGPECFTQEENYKLTKNINRKKAKTKKVFELEIVEEPIEIIKIQEKRIETDLIQKEKSNKRHLKIPVELEIMAKRYNEEFIELMEKLNNIMLKQGEPFRARAYQKAQETIMSYPDNILEPNQLKGLPGIGSTIMGKLNEYVETGTLCILEREKPNPINIFGEIYGVGPVKAKQLVVAGIKTIDELRFHQNELLNDIQKVGLKYYEQIQERIPRSEIEEFEEMFKGIFTKISQDSPDAKLEIVGSYRRGAETSGDIDVIISGNTGDVYKKFVDDLEKKGIILEILSRGPSKTLVIAKLADSNEGKEIVSRRIDFLYAPPDEFAFAILYFTGSKIFNTVMRQYGLDKGYTFNEHGIYKLENKKKCENVEMKFRTEKDIFNFLGLQFKTPIERCDGRSVIPYISVGEQLQKVPEKLHTQIKNKEETIQFTAVKKNKTLKIDSDEDILTNINNFKLIGISVVEQLNEKQLTDMIHLANTKYYNDVPVMTDNQYDIVKDFITNNFPDNNVTIEIGSEVERNKVRLPYEMASMDKIKPDTIALATWMDKYIGPYILSCKLDGVSGLYTTEDDKPKLYTRGNGKVGQDISHLIPFLRLPKTKGIVIRGEFIIPKALFEQKYKTTFANPRNMVAGIINHKHISDTIIDLHFVAYEVIVPQIKPSEQMDFLGTLNVERVLFEIVDSLSNHFLSELLVQWRHSYIYEIDGVIVTNDQIYPRKSGNPDHAFAFKMVLSDQIAEAKVVDVIWTPSKDGYLKPRVQIEPINLGGVKIEYATGFNAAFIKDNIVGIGSIIEIIRSGDVIPHIKSVTVPAEQSKMPSVPYKWNDTLVDIMLENASEDPTVKEKNITGFFRGIGVEGLSSGNITRLIKAGYDTVPEIIKMTEVDFLNVEGFKGKLSNKIYIGIHSKIDEASIITLMAASNIFGRGFSEKRMTLIMNELPDILISDESHNEKIVAITTIKGMAIKTAEAFVEKIDDFKDLLEECGLSDKLYEKPQSKSTYTSHPLFGKTVVLTGTREKIIIDYLKLIGANPGSGVSKNTFLVIAKNKDEDTGKTEEARKLDVPIMSVEEFIQSYITPTEKKNEKKT